ncbi:MAG: FG-GAP-like repeat-containing protein, partial [Saprospiraceae bacterium]
MKKNNISIFRWGTPGPWSKIWAFASLLVLAQVVGNAQVPFQLFGRVEAREAIADPGRRALPVGRFKLDRAAHARLMLEQPPSLQVPLPTDSSPVELLLERVELLTPDFKLTNERGEPFQVPAGVFYQGNIKGDSTSFVLLSCFEDQVSGYIGLEGRSYALDKRPGAAATLYDLITAESPAGEGDRPPLCGETTEVGGPRAAQQLAQQLQQLNPTTREFPVLVMDKMVTVHFECDNALYVSLGADPAAVQRFITQMFNSVHGIYRLEGIVVRIKSVRFWSVTDPYADQTTLSVGDAGQGVLRDFANEIGGVLPNGANLAHLLTTRTFGDAGGVAWRTAGVFCSTSWNGQHWVGPYAVSAFLEGNLPLPFYSWNAYVVAHEMGHNLGLPHTHNCAWVGGALDDCNPSTEGGCPQGPSPQNGGTIMSYCHQYQFINFRNAFGVQPGNLMRYNIAAAPCYDQTIEPRLLASSTQLNLGPAAGSGSIGVTTLPSGTDWQVSADATWVTLPQSEGKGNGSISFSYTANLGPSARSATIEIITETNTVSVRLLQSAPSLSVSLSPPVVLEMLPESGPVGTVLTLSGTGFNPVAAKNVVYIGPVAAKVLSATATSLSVRVPEGATHAPVTVLNKDNGLMGASLSPFMSTFDDGGGFGPNTLLPKVDVPLNVYPVWDIGLGDINGDGKTDMVVPHRHEPQPYQSSGLALSVFLNQVVPGGSVLPNAFVRAKTIVVRPDGNLGSPRAVKLADLDGDGRLDIAGPDEGANSIRVLLNTSAADTVGFATALQVNTPYRPWDLDIADIDGDGRLDIVVAVYEVPFLYVLRNSSGPGFLSFEDGGQFYTGFRTRPHKVIAQDFDTDGKIDVALACERSNTGLPMLVSVFRNVSTPAIIAFESAVGVTSQMQGYNPWGFMSSDLDGDGKPDLAALLQSGLSLFRNTSTPGSLSFAASVNSITSLPLFSNYPTVGDLDGDRKPEIVLVVYQLNENPKVFVYRNTSSSGNFSFGTPQSFDTGGQPNKGVIADVNGDARPDLIIPGGGPVYIYEYNLSGKVSGLSCGTVTHVGSLTAGTAASGASVQIPYLGGNGGTHNGQTVASTGVTGLTATLLPGVFAVGTGSLTYSITGTPSGAGTATFAINVGGLSCTLTRTVGSAISTLNCFSAAHSGTLSVGVPAAAVSSSIGYSGGNGGSHGGQVVASTGVTGLTATLAPGTFANGQGTLVYTITGTPSRTGTASFALSIGGAKCTLTRNVSAAIASLNCSGVTHNGTLTTGVVASGVSSQISYSGGNGAAYAGYKVLSTGVTGLTATLAPGMFANGAGTLTLSITGTPVGSGSANFALNIGGRGCTLRRTVGSALTSLDCAAAVHSGALAAGIAAAGVSSQLPYTGGNGSAYAGQTVASTGVGGLTATLAPGTFANGAGTLTYMIAGTADRAGTAVFALNIGGRACTLQRTVVQAGTIASLGCSSAVHSGTLSAGVAASSVSSSIPYTGGDGGAYPGLSIASTGVTGLTATLAPGTFANGAGTLTFVLSGTPSENGVARFALSLGGRSCVLERVIGTLPTGSVAFLDCIGATRIGALTVGSPASGVSSAIAYIGGVAGTHAGQVVASTGVTGLTATLPAGTIASGEGELTYTISGTPSAAGLASFAIDIGGQFCTLTR